MAVASIIYPGRVVIESKSRPPSACITSHHPSKWVDYCNNPADAWPLMHSNGIGVGFDEYEQEWVAFQLMRNGQVKHHAHTHSSTNPLLAAMIVFLQIQESANVQDNPAR